MSNKSQISRIQSLEEQVESLRADLRTLNEYQNKLFETVNKLTLAFNTLCVELDKQFDVEPKQKIIISKGALN